MKRLIYIFFLLPLLVSCESEISYSGKETAPVLVLEAMPQSGTKRLVCYINSSHSIVDNSKTNPETLKNVLIELSLSSGECRIVKDSISNYWHYLTLANPIPAGDTMRITVSHPDYPTITAKEFILPKLVPTIESLKKDTDRNGLMEYHLSLLMPDYPYADQLVGVNSVAYITRTQDTTKTKLYGRGVYSKDELFALSENRINLYYDAHYSNDEGYLFFRTNYPSGKRTDITLCTGAKSTIKSGDITYTYTVDSLILDFEVRSATYNYYYESMKDYVRQQGEFSGFASGMSLEEPLIVYSNVKNGYGIFASKTHTMFIIKDK